MTRAKKSKRFSIMLKHKELVKSGDLGVANLLLRLLVRGRIVLGYGDDEFEAERVLEKLGCVITYHRPHYCATAFDYGR